MATSGTTDYSITRDMIIQGALRLCGALGQGETPTTTQVSEASDALNMLGKAWEADGMPLWAMKEYSMTLTAGTNSYTVGTGLTVNIAKPLKVTQAYLHDTTSNVDVPMRIITREEYNRLGNKTSTGSPIQIFYEPLVTSGTIHLFPTPDSTAAASKQVTFVYQRPFEDWDSSTDNPDFPQEWYEALKYGLASRLAGEYGIEINDRRQLLQEANFLKAEALSFGTEEGSYFFKADKRDW